ncbi:hypothetical protein [Phosphitispora sp. TUW77]|uniref:hypothetical protein n=1 Tax=Phosphitispora sp. TUW77 TaxID=3152361 RepID=UPI003AB79F4C
MDDQKKDDLVTLWENMGASTGGFIGRLIGYTAQSTLQMYRETINKPLQQLNNSYNEMTESKITDGPTGEPDEPPDIRQQTWSEMGREFGQALGDSIGMSMDLFIKNMKNSATVMPGFNQNVPDHNTENNLGNFQGNNPET